MFDVPLDTEKKLFTHPNPKSNVSITILHKILKGFYYLIKKIRAVMLYSWTTGFSFYTRLYKIVGDLEEYNEPAVY